jgi:hypothetical protein
MRGRACAGIGFLIDGVWRDQWYDTKSTGGAFKRQEAQFRNWVTPDGAPGPSGDGGFKAESGRYHLFVSHACPWANRTMIFRALKGLEEHIAVSVVHPDMLGDGWTFDTDFDGGHGRHALRFGSFMREIYQRADPRRDDPRDRAVLWDTETGPSCRTKAPRSSGCSTPPSTGSPATRSISPEDLRPGSRRSTRASIRHQQRRLQVGLRHHAGGL